MVQSRMSDALHNVGSACIGYGPPERFFQSKDVLLRQRIGHHVIPRLSTDRAMAAGDDDYELTSVSDRIGHRGRLPAGRQPGLPELTAGRQIIGAKKSSTAAPRKATPPAVIVGPPIPGTPTLNGSGSGVMS